MKSIADIQLLNLCFTWIKPSSEHDWDLIHLFTIARKENHDQCSVDSIVSQRFCLNTSVLLLIQTRTMLKELTWPNAWDALIKTDCKYFAQTGRAHQDLWCTKPAVRFTHAVIFWNACINAMAAFAKSISMFLLP